MAIFKERDDSTVEDVLKEVVQEIKGTLEKQGFNVEAQAVPADSPADLVARKEEQCFVFDVKSPNQAYLTYDSIAQAKGEAKISSERYQTHVVPVIVGSFTVSEDVSSIAASNGVLILNIPAHLSREQAQKMIHERLTELTTPPQLGQ